MEFVQHKTVFLPCDVRIAGYTIKRVTLGHIRLLELVESPFVTGGAITAEDCAIALIILSSPWRKGLRRLRSPGRFALRVKIAMMLHDCGSARTLDAVHAIVFRVHWAPERFVDGKQGSASPYAPSSPFSVRMAVRAAKIPLDRLCHVKAGAWDCVWDVPVDAVMMYSVAQGESAGEKFMNPEEAEMAEEP